MSDITDIILRLEHQREAIDKAISALREVESGSGSSAPSKRVISAAGRKTISDVSHTTGIAVRPGKTLSAAARKKMADAQRRRWRLVREQAEAQAKAIGAKKKANRSAAVEKVAAKQVVPKAAKQVAASA